MKVTVSSMARNFMVREASLLWEKSPKAAERFSRDIRELGRRLSRMPDRGKVDADTLIPGVFRILAGEYLIDYQVSVSSRDILVMRRVRQAVPRIVIESDGPFEA